VETLECIFSNLAVGIPAGLLVALFIGGPVYILWVVSEGKRR